jgi:4-diphosphocytidyl-2-C-methyl-D-erythritol kinase
MSTLRLQAPAKLNLSLRVIKKRDDGFHEIDSVMVKLPGLSDELIFEPADAFRFHCSDPSLTNDESNLVVKAVRYYEAAASVTCSHAITLNKRIPHGAGLGGGSSDAATTLLAMEQIHGAALGMARLHEIAAALGSDIPFFLTDGAARVTGRGEIIESIPSPPSLNVLLLKPTFSVPTPDAYQRWSSSLALPGISYSPQEIEGLTLVNDLERPVFGKHRFLAELKSWLLHRAECSAALLCGSGSTLFAVLKPGADPEKIAKSARHELDPGLWHWIGRTAGFIS